MLHFLFELRPVGAADPDVAKIHPERRVDDVEDDDGHENQTGNPVDLEPRELDADDLVAVCVQHEMDHLDGTLFVDHVSSLKRNMILRKLQKSRRNMPATV